MTYGQWLQASQMNFKGGDGRQQKGSEMDIAQLSSAVENLDQNMMVKKSKKQFDIDIEISAELEKLMTFDHSQNTILGNIMHEKLEEVGRKESRDMGQESMGPKLVRISNAPLVDPTSGKFG